MRCDRQPGGSLTVPRLFLGRDKIVEEIVGFAKISTPVVARIDKTQSPHCSSPRARKTKIRQRVEVLSLWLVPDVWCSALLGQFPHLS